MVSSRTFKSTCWSRRRIGRWAGLLIEFHFEGHATFGEFGLQMPQTWRTASSKSISSIFNSTLPLVIRLRSSRSSISLIFELDVALEDHHDVCEFGRVGRGRAGARRATMSTGVSGVRNS